MEVKSDEGGEETVNRLFDMQVEEVSLVDRAANRHRFLVVKRDEDGGEAEGEQACSSDAIEDTPGGQKEHDLGSPAAASDRSEEHVDDVDGEPKGALASATAALEALTAAVAELRGDPTVAVLRTLAEGALSRAKKPEEPASPQAKQPSVPDLEGIVGVLRSLAERIGRLEKCFGTPNSRESAAKRAPDTGEVGWPMDMNAPLDRGSVDGSVSFHDV